MHFFKTRSLKFQMILFMVLPTLGVCLAVMILGILFQLRELSTQVEASLVKEVKNTAAIIEKENALAVNTSRIMALAQQSGLFSQREISSDYAQLVLQDSPELTASYFGYELNADKQDKRALKSSLDPLAMNEQGRFIPYWFREGQEIKLTPLVDMETSLYYNGVRELFLQSNKAYAMVTEPYSYEGKLIVEQTYPIIRNGKFVGIAGVDRALDDIENLIKNLKATTNQDYFLISRQGNFIASTHHVEEFQTKAINETLYAKLFMPIRARMVKKTIFLAEDPFDGRDYYFAFSPIPSGDWILIQRTDQETILAPLYEHSYQLLVIGLVGIVVILCLSFGFISALSRRVRAAADRAILISQGDMSALRKVGERAATTSANELTVAFNHMNRSLYSEWIKRQKATEQLSQERDFSKLIIDSSNFIICSLDADLRISMINPAGTKLWRADQESMLGQKWVDFFVEENVKTAVEEKIISDTVKIKDEQYEKYIDPRKDTHTLQWTFVDFSNIDGDKYHLGFGYDITELKKVEEVITQMNHDLEDVVKRRTLKLQESNIKLEEAFNELQQTQEILVENEKMASLGALVAGIAHEINTPIGITVTASSFVDELLNEFENQITSNKLSKSYLLNHIQQMRDSSTMIQNNLRRASDLIRSFKQVAVDQSVQVAYRFNVRENLEQVIVSLGHQLRNIENNIDVECDPALEIYSFPGEFMQIYTNLIQNSINHGFDGDFDGEKKITLKIALHQPNTLIIDYRDTGKGIPPEIVDKIFDPFVTTKRGKGGSGLGTHIMYNLITQLMKGTIKCESTLGEGAHFYITLPIQDEPETSDESTPI